MRAIPIIVAALLLASAPVRADWFPGGVVANDTGGIIPWSPDAEFYRHQIAADVCATWHKYAHISSVHRRYGDFIGFHCYFPPPYPVVITSRRTVVIRSKY